MLWMSEMVTQSIDHAKQKQDSRIAIDSAFRLRITYAMPRYCQVLVKDLLGEAYEVSMNCHLISKTSVYGV